MNRPSSAYEHHYSPTRPPLRSLRAMTLSAGDRRRRRNRRHGTTAAELRARIGRGGTISRPGAPIGVLVAPRPSRNHQSRSIARVHELRTGMTRRFYIGVDYCATFAVPPKHRDSQCVETCKDHNFLHDLGYHVFPILSAINVCQNFPKCQT